MLTSWQIECLRARMRSLRSEIRRVSEKDHPYPEPDAIYKALIGVVESRIKLFDEAIDLFSDVESQRDLRASFNTIAKDIQRVAEEFSLADRVDSARIPFEILRALSWVANSLLGEDCRTVVRLDTAQNYTISSCRRRFEDLGWAEQWETGINGGAERLSTVLVLGFPSSDAASILLHALAAHEFGHQIAYKTSSLLIALRDRLVLDIKREYNEELQNYVEDNVLKRGNIGRDDAYEESRKLVEARLLRLTDNWLVEVFSDLVAARLVGPAFLAAFDRMLLELASASLTHPPGYLRRRLVRKYLSQGSPEIVKDSAWSQFFERQEEVAEVRRSGDRDQRDAFLPLYPLGERVCELALGGLTECIADVTSPFDGSNKETLDRMEEAIVNLAPPSIVLEPSGGAQDATKFWLLMYAGWHFRLSEERFSKFAQRYGWDDGKAEDVLGNLILHSLQALEFRHRWEQRRMQQFRRDASVCES